MNSNINELLQLNEQMSNAEIDKAVEDVKIVNPAKEIENSLAVFLTSRLAKLEKDANFEDLLKAYIRQRLPEATFEQLMQLHHEISADNSQNVRDTTNLFRNENSGKIITEHLKDSEVSSAAQQLYDSTDNKQILQSVGYLSQIMGKFAEMTADTKKSGTKEN